jgi:Uma2 family endonuclease
MITQKTITMAEAAEFSERMHGFAHFEFADGQIIPVHSMEPVDESFIDYVLSPDFFNKPSTPSFPVPTQKHDKIVRNLQGNLFIATQGKDFTVYCQTTLIHIPVRAMVSENQNYREPDIVLLSESQEKRNVLHQVLNPLLVIEVLSPSTQARDKYEKVEEYQSIDSLEQYIIVWQDRMKVIVYSKIGEDHWDQKTITQPTEPITFSPILPGNSPFGYQMTLETLYVGISMSGKEVVV